MNSLITSMQRYLDRGGYALADQVIAGGMNFLTMILVGRLAGAHQLGLFALGLSIVYMVIAVQESIVTTPATIASPRLGDEERRQFFGASLVMQGTLSALVFAVLLSASCAVWFTPGHAEGAAGLAVLAIVAPLWCLREFCRRLAFAQLNPKDVLALDAFVAVLLGSGLAGLIATNQLSAATAFAAAGMSAGVGAACWLMLRRRYFQVDVRKVSAALRGNMVTGKWILSGQATSIATAEAMPWIVAGMLGTEATGVFAACRAIFRVANPFVVTVSNLITPYAAHAYAEGGQSQVNSIVRSAMLGLGALMTVFLLFLAAFGGVMLELLFGPQFAQHYWILIILAVSQIALLVRMGPARGLMVVDRPQLGVAAELLGCTVLLASAVPLIAVWGLYGAAASVLASTASATLVCIVLYRHVSVLTEQTVSPATSKSKTSSVGRQPAASPCLEAVE